MKRKFNNIHECPQYNCRSKNIIEWDRKIILNTDSDSKTSYPWVAEIQGYCIDCETVFTDHFRLNYEETIINHKENKK